MLQLGGLSKAAATCLICGLALYIATKTAAPSRSVLIMVTLLTMMAPIVCVAVSLTFKTARVFCRYDGNVIYSDASESTQHAVIAYTTAVLVPIYVCIAVCATFSILLHVRVGNIMTRSSLVNSGHATEEQQLMHVVARMKWYPIIVIAAWVPVTIIFIADVAFQRYSMIYTMISLVFFASSGIGIAAVYFSYQKTFPPFLMKALYPALARDPSLLAETRVAESIGASWSEGPSSSAGSTLTGGTLSEVAMGRSSTLLSSTSPTQGRTYSLAQSLLPRFFSRSRSTGTKDTGISTGTDSYY